MDNISRHEKISLSDNEDIIVFLSHSHGDYVSSHWHEAIEIIYIISGDLNVTISGIEYQLTKDTFILVNSKIIHSTRCTTENQAFVLQVPDDYIRKYIPNIDTLIFQIQYNTKNPIEQTKLLRIKEILNNMRIVYEYKPDGGMLKFNSLLFDLLYSLYHNFRLKIPKVDYNKRTKNLYSLKPILEYINENYTKQITIDEIAKIAGFQPKYFCRFFKMNIGITFLEYLNELRLSYIYRDLMSTNIPIYKLLEVHGFNNYKLFRHMFYERFKNTPNNLRNLNKV